MAVLGLGLAIIGILTVALRESIVDYLPKHKRKTISLVLVLLGATVGIAGSLVQHVENQNLQAQLTHNYRRDAERLRQLGTFAWELGWLSTNYFTFFEDQMLGRPYPYGEREWFLRDFESGIKARHAIFDITFNVPPFEELSLMFHGAEASADPFDILDNIYGSNYYVTEIGRQIWAQEPSTALAEWFSLSSGIKRLAHLIKTRQYVPTREMNDELETLIRIGWTLGIQRGPFENWAAELLVLEGDDFDMRTSRFLREIEQYKLEVWDVDPFVSPRRG